MLFKNCVVSFFMFVKQGSDLAYDETLSAAALAACRTLVEELTEQRFPAPRVLTFKV